MCKNAYIVVLLSVCLGGCETNKKEACWDKFVRLMHNDDLAGFQELLDECDPGADYRGHGWTFLHGAAMNDKLAFAEMLLEKGVDPVTGGAPGSGFRKPLDVALERRSERVVALLEAKGVKPTDFKAECEAKGGVWGGFEAGRGRITGCNLPTKDGGKPCQASDECEGACMRGKCTGLQQARGCGILVRGKDGQIRAMCRD